MLVFTGLKKTNNVVDVSERNFKSFIGLLQINLNSSNKDSWSYGVLLRLRVVVLTHPAAGDMVFVILDIKVEEASSGIVSGTRGRFLAAASLVIVLLYAEPWCTHCLMTAFHPLSSAAISCYRISRW